jgi:23S rRNA pseudouridine1911/1915/1917 synthase
MVARIVFEDSGLVVVDKPPGFVSAGPARQIHGEPRPRESVESLLIKGLGRPVWAVHQLDRLTSGLNCFVLRASLVSVWADRLKIEQTKRYLALTHGRLEGPPQRVDLPLGMKLDPRTGKTFPAVLRASDPSARPAHSLVRPLAVTAPHTALPASLVEVTLETGRQHQVRLHLAALGHPLIGENLHREPPCALHPRHALHAAALDFLIPSQTERLKIRAPLPADLVALANHLGLPLRAPAIL